MLILRFLIEFSLSTTIWMNLEFYSNIVDINNLKTYMVTGVLDSIYLK